jgi:transposase InsO family protein
MTYLWLQEFTGRFWATGQRKPTGSHPFDKVCSQHGIDHRLIKPRHPQTNGKVGRFNGRISEVLDTTRFDSAQSSRCFFSRPKAMTEPRSLSDLCDSLARKNRLEANFSIF